MPTNAITSVMFRPVQADGTAEGGHALLMALDVAAPERLFGFLEDVIARFKLERLAGPPDTHLMLITVLGEVSAGEFASAWRAATANDAPARALLGAFHRADVIHGEPGHAALGQASLLTR